MNDARRSRPRPAASPPSQGTPEKPESSSLALRAYSLIKDRILSCQLEPGTMVSAYQLVEEYGMSRTPIQAALKMLVSDGLVQVYPRLGYIVSPVTVTDVLEIYQVRLALEPLAVDIGLRRATDRQLEAFRRALDQGRPDAAPSAMDPAFLNAVARAHRDFHLRVAALSGNHRLTDMIRGLLEESQRTFIAGTVAEFQTIDWVNPSPHPEHKAIIDAVLARDRPAAVRAVADHVRSARESALRTLVTEPVDYGDWGSARG